MAKDDFKWTVLESRRLVDDRYLSLRLDRCRTPHGAIVERYYVLEFAPWVNMVAITPQNELVMVRQYRHGIERTLLELPCGYVDPGEEPLAAAKRELAEETGYSGHEFIEVGRLSANPATHNNLTHCYLIPNAFRVGEPQPEKTEQLEVVLKPLPDVIRMMESGELLQALHLGSLFLALRKLGHTF